MEDVNKIMLSIVLGAVIIGIAVFVSFGSDGGVTGGAVREVKESVVFEGKYECNSNVYNCGSFDSRADAVEVRPGRHASRRRLCACTCGQSITGRRSRRFYSDACRKRHNRGSAPLQNATQAGPARRE